MQYRRETMVRPSLHFIRPFGAWTAVGAACLVLATLALPRRSTAQAPCNRTCEASKRDASGCCPTAPAPARAPSAPSSGAGVGRKCATSAECAGDLVCIDFSCRVPVHAPPPPAPYVPAPPAEAAPAPCPAGMARLPAGTYTLGDRHDTVTVQPFCMDITEVTVAAYGACVSANACAEPNPYLTDEANKFSRACNWKRPGAGLHPVNCVDWGQATSYCAWAGKRLPSEDEWEWAARGGNEGRVYPWGSEPPTADRVNACGTECVAWGKANLGADVTAMYAADDGWPITAPVGSFPRGATAQGLQDMAGNVWEWTSSNYDATARVSRGGGWYSTGASILRAAIRPAGSPRRTASTSLGFRCAR